MTTAGIIRSKRSQLARYCLVWGIRPVCGPATVGQVTKIKGFTSYGPVHRVYFFSFLVLSMRCKCLSKMHIDREYEERSQCDAQVLTSHLNSLTSKPHTRRKN